MSHPQETLIAALGVLLLTGAFATAAMVEPIPIEGRGRAFLLTIEAEAGTKVEGEWTTTCPPDQSCVHYTRTWFPVEGWWSRAEITSKGDNWVYVGTPMGGLYAPIWNGTSDSGTMIVNLNQTFEEAGTALIMGFATDPWSVSVKASDGTVAFTSTEEAHWYRPSDFPSLVQSKLVLPGVAIAGDLQWTAEHGSIGIFLPADASGVVGYHREGPMGTLDYCPIEPVCFDVFWGPAGDYRMSHWGMFEKYNVFMAGWADLPIPAEPCNACGLEYPPWIVEPGVTHPQSLGLRP